MNMPLQSLLDFNVEAEVDPEVSEALLKLVKTESADDSSWLIELLDGQPYGRIIKDRLGMAKLTASPAAIMFCVTRCDRPAYAVMWAYTLCHIARRLEKDHVDVSDVASFFNFGLPTEESMKSCWMAQKQERESGRTDNGMDIISNWYAEKHG